MKYIKVTGDFIDVSKIDSSITSMIIEVDEQGKTIKEIGFNSSGKMVHKFPSDQYKFGKHGLLDLTIIDQKGLSDDLSKEEFYKLWEQ